MQGPKSSPSEMDLTRQTLSIVIPAFNEARAMPVAMEAITRYLDGQGILQEYVLVDDRSTDNTLDVLESLTGGRNAVVLRNFQNMGKGFSIRRGMLEASGAYVLFTDADLSTPIEELGKMLPYLADGYDVVIGSRRLPESEVVLHQAWYRELLGEVFYKLIHTFFLSGINDINCGFKIFSKKASQELFRRQTINGWGFDAEVLYLATKLGFRVKEVGVKWSDARDTKVKVASAAINTLGELVKIKINDLKKRYE